MTIDFYIKCECTTWTWNDCSHIPSIEDVVVHHNDRYEMKNYKVVSKKWITPKHIEILVDEL